jgi:hypothetical protein
MKVMNADGTDARIVYDPEILLSLLAGFGVEQRGDCFPLAI